MKNKKMIWYIGYVVSVILVLIIFLTDFSKMVDIGLAILFTGVFSVSHTQILHNKLMKEDRDYKVSVMDERNITIKEKSWKYNEYDYTSAIRLSNCDLYLFRLSYPSNYYRWNYCFTTNCINNC